MRGNGGGEMGATAGAKRSSASTGDSATVGYLGAYADPVGRRRVLHARYKLLLELEAQSPRHAASRVEDEEEDEVEEDGVEEDGGGECWLSRLLAGWLTLLVSGYICYMVAQHRQLFA